MSRHNDQPFDRGQTLYGPDATIDANDLQGAHLLGMEKEFEDLDYGSTSPGALPHRTGEKVVCRLVRNTSGVTLLGKRLVKLNAAGTEATGYATVEAERCAATDEWLTSAGVRANDVFWAVVRGPAVVTTPVAGSDFGSDIAAGDRLQSMTTSGNSTTTGTTAHNGRANKFTTVAATTVAQFNSLMNHVTHFVGTAISARTTGETNAAVLVNFRPRF